MPQTYDITESYESNYHRGPSLTSPLPEVPTTPTKEFLGLKVRSRLGIAAGLLLNSKWIQAYARLGFDLLTYKTVRSSPRACYPPPNWVFVEDRGSSGPVYETVLDETDPENATSAVCFGMPSMHPDVWREDVKAAATIKYASLREPQAEVIYSTSESLAKKRAELEHLLKVEIPTNKKAIQVAREMGDLSENFEYKSARQRDEYLSARKWMVEAADLVVDTTARDQVEVASCIVEAVARL